MNKIKAAIIEDEIPAGRLLHKMLSGLRPDWDIVVLPGSIEGSVKWFQEHPHPDIIFLDIQLTDGISFAFIEQAQPESMIIFTTAYDEYAIRAFTVNSIDYLLKPINRERLAEAIEKFERLTARYGNTTLSNSSNELLNLLKNISNPEKKYRTRFLISGDEKLYTLQVEDIAYFYSENKITFAVRAYHRFIARQTVRTTKPRYFFPHQPANIGQCTCHTENRKLFFRKNNSTGKTAI